MHDCVDRWRGKLREEQIRVENKYESKKYQLTLHSFVCVRERQRERERREREREALKSDLDK